MDSYQKNYEKTTIKSGFKKGLQVVCCVTSWKKVGEMKSYKSYDEENRKTLDITSSSLSIGKSFKRLRKPRWTYGVVVEQTPRAASGGVVQGAVGEGAVGELSHNPGGTPEGRTPCDQHEERVREHGDQ